MEVVTDFSTHTRRSRVFVGTNRECELSDTFVLLKVKENKGLVFIGRGGAIRTPDPLRLRQFPAFSEIAHF